MEIDSIFTWYQQKIGTYDKQKWETKIEQRAQRIYGLNHIQTRSTKPNTDLIDLDLVRGSSFTKAKPKHGFIEVSKLATLRCIFLPFYGNWWIKQTSKYIFIIGFIVYAMLIINVFLFLLFSSIKETSETITFKDILIPFLMMWILSLIHSQIVATSPLTERHSPQTRMRHFKKRRYNKKKQLTINKNEVPEIKMSEMGQNTNSVEDKEETQLDNSITHASTDSESGESIFKDKIKFSNNRSKVKVPAINITSQDSNLDTEEELPSSPETKMSSPLSGELTSATDWMGVTTNSEDCSYSSDLEDITDSNVEKDDCSTYDNELAPTAILNPPFGKVSCLIWDRKNEVRKAELSMLEISSTIIGKVEAKRDSMDYFYIGIFFSTILAFLPVICRVISISTELTFSDIQHFLDEVYVNITMVESLTDKNRTALSFYKEIARGILGRGANYAFAILNGCAWEYIVLTISLVQRWILASMIFFLLAAAERTFKQRLLYAKFFSHLTSSRRAQKSDLPHFRLNKVINIKTWLSVRSYLKKRGPQRSVDIIVSTAFVVNLLLLTFLCVEVLKDTVLFTQYYIEALIWCLGLGILLLRFMTLGTKINKKYRNLSVLITEQINLHLQLEQKPQKKEEYNVANNVLKLAIDLLKELENPFKISGISANPILYNVTKLVILSALSGVLSEMLGFKLKLHKIKLK